MTKREYLEIAMGLPTDWLRKCAADPSSAMRPVHVRIIRLVLRKRGAALSSPAGR